MRLSEVVVSILFNKSQGIASANKALRIIAAWLIFYSYIDTHTYYSCARSAMIFQAYY